MRWGDEAIRAGFDAARSERERIERDQAASLGATRLSTLKVGDTFEYIGEAEWFGDGRKAKRHTITEIIVKSPYANRLMLRPDNGYYSCLPGGITDVWVKLVERAE